MKTFSTPMFTDLYELTMAYGYWKLGMADKKSVFHLFFRKYPFQGGYAIAAGLQTMIEYLEEYQFTADDLEYLSGLTFGAEKFDQKFLDFLGNMKFSCDIDAAPEGTVVFPNQPLVRVKGPLLQAQLLESLLLNIINFQSLIATKASRVVYAAKGDPVIEFGMRRAQGVDGGMSASRAAYIGGCESTSNTLAGKWYGIPVRGTMAHSWVMAFEGEKESFSSYADVYPTNLFFLIDTYDTALGAKNAIDVSVEKSQKLKGVRLDSGELASLSRLVRRMMDENGFSDAKIMASNELDEHLIKDLKRKKACIDIWGVGTNLVTGKEQPALDGVYKLSAIEEKGEFRDVIKLSEQMSKTSYPGILQVRRFFDKSGYIGDIIYDVESSLHQNTFADFTDSFSFKDLSADLESRDLLVPVFRNGKNVYGSSSLEEIRRKLAKEWKLFPKGVQKLKKPAFYPYGIEKQFYEKMVGLMKKRGQ